MRFRLPVWSLLGLAAGAGCVEREYDVAMSVEHGRLKRTTTVTAKGPDVLDEAAATRIAAEFQQPTPPEVKKSRTFSGTFAERTPNDVGGFGRFASYESPAGTAYTYLERLRGGIDAVREIEGRYRAVDRFVDHLLGWCATEAGNDEDFPKLKAFLDATWRHDMKNLSVLALASEIRARPFAKSAGNELDEDIPARVAEFLMERDYVRPSELPQIARAMQTNDVKRLGEWVRRVVARQMGAPENAPPPKLLNFIADLGPAADRLTAYLKRSPDFAETMEQMPNAPAESVPLWVMGVPLLRALRPYGFPRAHDELNLTFETPRAPFWTNGTWDEARREVIWNASIESSNAKSGHEWPRLCFATWAVPNTDYQRARFGDVLLVDNDLVTYSMWYQGLSVDERAEWDRLLQATSPGDGFIAKLKGFRFQEERDEPTDAAHPPRRLAESIVVLLDARFQAMKLPH